MDVDTTIEELRKFRDVGGGAIVDATTAQIGRNPDALARISRESGVHIVMGAGFYVGAVHPDDMDERTEERSLAREIIGDIVDGVGGSGVKGGHNRGGRLHVAPGPERAQVPVGGGNRPGERQEPRYWSTPGGIPDAPLEILDLLADRGADISRVIMGHLDRTVFEFDAVRSIAASGCYLEWDLFGNEGSYYPLAEIDMPSDAQRLDFIKRAVDAGYSDRVVIGQDIATRHRLVKIRRARLRPHSREHRPQDAPQGLFARRHSSDNRAQPGQDTRPRGLAGVVSSTRARRVARRQRL